MGDQTWDVGELQQAAGLMRQAGQAVNAAGGLLRDPDPAMYGRLVMYAAQHAEPLTTQRHRDFLTRLGSSLDGIGEGLSETAHDYQQIESTNVDLTQNLRSVIDAAGRLR